MKIKRRDFMALGVGLAVGTTLTPISWKLTDDISIWTQNWSWTPVPKRGEVSHVNSVCMLCPGGCGISVRKVDDRVVKIEGREGHPLNQGGLCGLGISGTQLLYGPSRISSPMKRKGERGEGKWEKISWDEAIETVAGKVGNIQSAGKKDALAVIASKGAGTVPALFHKLLEACASEKYFRPASMHDTGSLVAEKMFGRAGGRLGYDVANAATVLSFGCGLLEGWGSPAGIFRSVNRAGLIQVEPRLSTTAAAAGKWVPAKPGSETALALGIACVIITESLYNRGAVENTKGFDDFKKTVCSDYTPDKVAAVTGITKKEIVDIARKFARSSSPLALCGKGNGMTAGSAAEFSAVHALNVLVGNINKKGGVFLFKKETDSTWVPDFKLPEAIIEKGAAPLDMLLVWDANPLYTLPDTKKAKEALKQVPFIVSFSSYMDETASYSDLILPNHIYLERSEDVFVEAGGTIQVIGLTQPVTEPLLDTMHTGDALISIAKGAGDEVSSQFEWEDYPEYLEQSMGDAWETLSEEGFTAKEKSLLTRIDELVAPPSADFGFIAGQSASVPLEGGEGKFPLILVPTTSMRLASGHIADTPFMMKIVEDTDLRDGESVVELNPSTARKYGLKDGKPATLSTPRGSCRVRIRFFDGIMPGLAAMPKGLGHDAYDAYVSGKGVNYNAIAGAVEDPVSGFNGAWGMRAELRVI